MRERFAEGRQASGTGPGATKRSHSAGRAARMRAMPFAAAMVCAFLTCGLLTGCSSGSDTSFTFLADPGKYEFYSCEQLATDTKALTKRRQDLKSLMDRADQSAGGAAVGFIAYKADYVAAEEEVGALRSTARSKSCDQDATWRSSTAIR